MAMPVHIKKWWNIANDRRQRLINQKYRTQKGLTLDQENEYRLLQAVAEEILDYGEREEIVRNTKATSLK